MLQKPKDDKKLETTDISSEKNVQNTQNTEMVTDAHGDCDVQIQLQKDNSVVVTLTLKAAAAKPLSKVGNLLKDVIRSRKQSPPVLTPSEAKEITMRSIKDVTDSLNDNLKAKSVITESIALHDFHPAFSTVKH